MRGTLFEVFKGDVRVSRRGQKDKIVVNYAYDCNGKGRPVDGRNYSRTIITSKDINIDRSMVPINGRPLFVFDGFL